MDWTHFEKWIVVSHHRREDAESGREEGSWGQEQVAGEINLPLGRRPKRKRFV